MRTTMNTWQRGWTVENSMVHKCCDGSWKKMILSICSCSLMLLPDAVTCVSIARCNHSFFTVWPDDSSRVLGWIGNSQRICPNIFSNVLAVSTNKCIFSAARRATENRYIAWTKFIYSESLIRKHNWTLMVVLMLSVRNKVCVES